MFKIYEDNKLVEETTSGTICVLYQAFRYNDCNIEDSISNAKTVHWFWVKLDYSVDLNKLVDYICYNKIDLNDFDYRKLMIDFNEWIDCY